LNYTEANDLVMAGSAVEGVNAVDRFTGQTSRYHAPVVVNAAGPWSRKMAEAFHKDIPALFRPSLAWNLLIDRPALSDHALAVSPQQNQGHTYFLVPWQGKLFSGTGHVPIEWKPGMPVHPSDEQIAGFLADLNNAVPNLSLTPSDIIHVHAGLLPAKKRGGAQLAVREAIVDHGKQGGPQGLYSVSGVKFTTARLVAEKTIRVFAQQCASYTSEGMVLPKLTRYEHRFKPILISNGTCDERDHLLRALRSIIQDESVCCLEDVIFRRTALYENTKKAMDVAPDILRTMRTDEDTSEKDLTRLANLLTHQLTTP
jgi:glycerol-3-phosphate dehydrogenase